MRSRRNGNAQKPEKKASLMKVLAVKKIFNESGLGKLQSLLAQLEKIRDQDITQQTNGYRSESSFTAVKNACTVLQMLVDNQKISAWVGDALKGTAQKALKLLSTLDGGKQSWVPDVYNGETYHMAMAMYPSFVGTRGNDGTIDESTRLDVKGEIHKDLYAFIDKSVENSQRDMRLMREDVISAVKFYELMLQGQQFAQHDTALRQGDRSIDTIMGSLNGRASELELAEYEEIVKGCLTRMAQIPYLRIADASSLLNHATPYELSTKCYKKPQNRGIDLIGLMLRHEICINQARIEAGLPIFTTVYNAIAVTWKGEKQVQFAKDFSQLVNDFETDIKSYVSSGTGVLKKSKNKTKVANLNLLIVTLKEIENGFSQGRNVLEGIYSAFAQIVETMTAEVKSKTQDITNSVYMQILARWSMRCFGLTLQLDSSNDQQIAQRLTDYAQLMNLSASAKQLQLPFKDVEVPAEYQLPAWLGGQAMAVAQEEVTPSELPDVSL